MPDYENLSKQQLVGELQKMQAAANMEYPADAKQLLHELQVHQIKLEMQNREKTPAE